MQWIIKLYLAHASISIKITFMSWSKSSVNIISKEFDFFKFNLSHVTIKIIFLFNKPMQIIINIFASIFLILMNILFFKS